MGEAARAFWVVEPGRGEIRTEPLPAPGPRDVRVRTLASGISRGTESLVFRGLVPPELADEMRCPFQAGAFPGPVKYGYCLVGVVDAIGAGVEPGMVGRRVFVLHPHQDLLVVPASSCRPVPDAVPTRRAVLAANMETAVNILWDAGATVGQRIAVVGAGVVGCLTARLAARMPGAAVRLVDVDPARSAVAAALDVEFSLPDAAPGDRDLVVHTSGTESGLATALALAGREATVVEASWYGTAPVRAPLGAAFHPRRLRLVSSQVGQVSPAQRPRWSHGDRLDLALRMLDDAALDALLEAGTDFADLPARMPGIAAGRALCRVVDY